MNTKEASFYREIFLKSKREIDRRLDLFSTPPEKQNYLKTTLKNEILKSQSEIKTAFNKINCANCGACCRLAVSEFSCETLKNKAKNGDKTAKSFLETFELYKNNTPPENLLPKNISVKDVYFYHCKKMEFKNGKSFCPVYDNRPAVCRNFPDTPLENLPKNCAYNKWKEENETKALFIKALNDIRHFYINELCSGSIKKDE